MAGNGNNAKLNRYICHKACPMEIAILQFRHSVMSSVFGSYEIFRQLGELATTFHPGLDMPTLEVSIVEEQRLDMTPQFDLVIIPAMHFNTIDKVLHHSGHMITWIRDQYRRGGEVASICLGSFLLASTGLLDHSVATTHWMGAEMFRRRFPRVYLVDDKIVTDFNRLYTSGGAYSFTTLMIYLIEKYFGRELAILASKVFLIHLHDSNQDSYKILNLQKSHSIEPVLRVQEYIEKHAGRPLSIEQLAGVAHMSVRTFMRNFKKATGETPNVYIQKVRIEKAKRMLESGLDGIEQVSKEAGYSDFASFRKVFKRFTGLTPSEYKRLYARVFTETNVAKY